jgi:hypothetical protein
MAICEAHQHESTTADISRSGFDDGKRERNSDRGINCIPATFQDFYSRLRSELFVGCDHSVRRTHGLLRPIFRIDGMWPKFSSGLRARNAGGDERKRERDSEMLRAQA